MSSSASGEIQLESRALSGNENQNEQSVIDECRIYKAPYHLRKWNEEAYTPHVISIGPYHHNKEKFQNMEKHKVRYFKRFMQQNNINLEDLEQKIRDMEGRIQRCYVETAQLNSDDFVQMIKLDAIFILELFLKYRFGGWEIDDPIFVEAWLGDMVLHELLLLENQLPFFVINELYHLTLPFCSKYYPLIELTFNFFDHLNIHNKDPKVEIQHFTDLLRFFRLPPHDRLLQRKPKTVFPKYSVTQLREAGVKFKEASSKCILGLNFEKGVLEIPLLDFQDDTEAYIRNVMALEQCDGRVNRHITDFYSILDRLIDTDKDVDLLCDKGIIVNHLGNNNVITSMINKLNRGIFMDDMNSDYQELCEDLNAFYEESWHRRKALLRHQYFSSPWKAASTIAAIILLVLTFIQTVCSIIQIVPIVKSW